VNVFLRKLSLSILVSFVVLNMTAPSFAQVQTASLHQGGPWRRISPTPEKLDGPVLYQIIFRSSATPNHVPAISSNFTLMDSPITVGGSNVAVGGMSIDGSTGKISFANGQIFAGDGSALTNLNAANIGTGTVPAARLPLGSSSDTTAGLLVQANDTRLSDARTPAPGSGSYIQNTNTPQAANLSITGNATVGGTVSGFLQSASSTTAPSCNSQVLGGMYFNTASNQLNVCNGTTWRATNTGALLADYEFDETSGTSFADSSGFGDSAISSIGGIAAGSAGHSGKSINFSGGTVVANNVPDSPQVYVEAWINPQPGGGSTTTILNKGGIFYLKRIPSAGQVVFGVTINNVSCAPTVYANTALNTWSHVSGWYNGESVTVEANGQTVTAQCALGPLPFNSNASFVIAADDAGGTNSFPGSIDEVRIWSVAPPPNNSSPMYVQNSSSSVSTTSTSFTNLGLDLTVNVQQVPYLITVYLGGATAGVSGGGADYRILEDGINVVFTAHVAHPQNATLPLNFSAIYNPGPGPHVLQVQFASTIGTQITIGIGSTRLLLAQRLQ
jgi:hypothetical protein